MRNLDFWFHIAKMQREPKKKELGGGGGGEGEDDDVY